jgi:AcrR family transcriptional regulator
LNNDSKQARMSRKEREFQARRQEILAAATRLFANQGYHGTSMSEIAREAEFSTGSLYNFFRNKEELYFELLQEKISLLETRVYSALEGPAGVLDKLGTFVDVLLHFFEAERDFFRIFAEQRGQFELSAKGQFADVIHERYEKYLGAMVNLMRQGIEEGIFKALNPAELALILMGILNTMLFIYVNSKDSYSLKDKRAVILDVFLSGTRRS